MASKVTFSPCNYVAYLDHNQMYPDFYIIADFLRKSPLYKALTYAPKMSKHLLANFWATCEYDATTKEVRASVLSTSTYDVSFTVDDLRRVLDLPTFSPYENLPSTQDLNMVATTIGYVPGLDDKDRTPLFRKYMGGVWNFFFLHLIQCLSSKTGSMDQAYTSIKRLAYVLIFQKKIDFAAYFFGELVKRIDSSNNHNVPFVRFISMLIADKLGSNMPADVGGYYDLKVSQMGLQSLKKKSFPTDHPLPLSMVSFATCPNPVWGEYFSKRKIKLESHPTSEPCKSRKRLLSELTPFGFSSKKSKTAKNKGSQPSSKVVELGPIEATKASDSSLVPSQKDIAGDDSDISPFLGPSSPPHAHGLPPEIDNLDDINIEPHVDVVDKNVQQTQVSERFDSTSEIPQSSLADLIACVTALSDSQSAILQSLADLHARSNAQTEVNRAILRSLKDLHLKVDSQTKISNMVLEKTAIGLGTSRFTEVDRELLNQIGQRVEDDHGLLDGIHSSVARLLDDSDNRDEASDEVDASGNEDGNATFSQPIDLSVAAEANKSLLAKDKADTTELEKVDPKREEEAQVKKAKRIKWYNDSHLHRCITASITSVRIKGPEKLTYDSDQIFLIIGRANGVVRTEKLCLMHAYGVSEWIEMIEFIKQSRSMYREYVLSHFNELMKKIRMIENHYNLSASSRPAFYASTS